MLPHTNSFGGAGGDGGSVVFDGVLEVELATPINANPGDGFPGGDAFSVPPGGFPRDASLPPDFFPFANATGGPGGHSGMAPTGPGFAPGIGVGGIGGTGDAMAINGADGSDLFGPGLDGGDGFASGGAGGHAFGGPGAPGGDAFVSGGNGGNAFPNCPVIEIFDLDGTIRVITDTDGSDNQMVNAGTIGIPYHLFEEIVGEGGGPGFAGGNGGDLNGIWGDWGFNQADPLNDFFFGAPGTLTIGPGGNGGAMGRGLSQGTGGMAGTGPAIPFVAIDPIFTDGFESGDVSAWSCSTPAPPAGAARAPAAVAVAVTQAIPGTITLSGSGAWVEVSGPIAADGTITAVGIGTVAGVPSISVSFSGTFDEQAGTLVGNYSMDTTSAISPGHPVVYGLDMTVTPPAAGVEASEGNR